MEKTFLRNGVLYCEEQELPKEGIIKYFWSQPACASKHNVVYVWTQEIVKGHVTI